MPGPPPKDPKQRRRTNMPTRGEWIDLWEARLQEPAHPALSTLTKARWSAESRKRWDAWRHDPVALYWTESDLAFALETLAIYEREDDPPWPELSRRWDRLGLTPKGKRDLRFRIRFAPWEEPGLEPRPEEPTEPAAPNVTPIGARRSSLSA